MARIVLSTWGSLGDLHPFLALAVELTSRGHRAVVASLPSWREAVEQAGVGFHPVGPDIPEDQDEARELVRRVLDAHDGPSYLFEKILGPATRESYDALLAGVTADGGADLLVTHQIPLTGPLVAEVTGIRWVSALVQPLGFLSSHDPPSPPQAPWLRGVMAVHPSVAGALFRVARLVARPWVRPTQRFRAELGLPPGGNPVFEGQHSPRLSLALFSRWLAEKQPDFPPQTLVTGFPFYDAAAERPVAPELLDFLDAGDPPVLVTLGSSAVWIAGDFYEASIEAITRIGRRALLLAGEDSERLTSQGLPDGVAAFAYAPHSLVMPRAAANVHQGGVGTTAQAMRAGRPVLVVPFGQDQPDNARRSVRLGMARTVTRGAYSPARVARELSALLDDPSYAERAAAVAGLVRAEHGTETACDAIEQVLREPAPRSTRR
ncbi:MAG: glycosyltransferase [Vicinamibacterales bacterium]